MRELHDFVVSSKTALGAKPISIPKSSLIVFRIARVLVYYPTTMRIITVPALLPPSVPPSCWFFFVLPARPA